MLVCVAFLAMGASWVYDFPGAMYTFLATRFGSDDYSTSKNQVLYSVYSWPNVIIVLLAGFMVDQWLGLGRTTVVASALILAGQCIFSLALQSRLYWLAVVGRFVFGLGGESIRVAQSTWIVLLSDRSNMSWRFGVVLSVSRLAGAINFALTPTIGKASILAAVWLGTGINVLSLLAAILLIRLYRQQQAVEEQEAHSVEMALNPSKASQQSPCPAARASCSEVARRQIAILRSFPTRLWVQFGVCVFYHVGVLLLYQFASQFLQNTGAFYSERTASLLVAIPAFIGIVGTPLAGRMVDAYGHALHSIVFASLLLMGSHLLLITYVLNWVDSTGVAGVCVCVVALVVVGVSFSIATASIWPLVPFLLPPSQLATGYGTMASVEKLGLAIMPLLISSVQDANSIKGTTWQYAVPLLLLMFTAAIAACIAGVQIHIDSKYHDGMLNKPAAQRTMPTEPAQRESSSGAHS